mgnify:CR=1 FL=1
MSQIKSYKQLLEEKNRLEVLVQTQKQLIKDDWAGIKDEFKPVKNVMGFAKKFIIADKSSPIISLISGIIADRVLRKFIFKNADWVTRLVAPLLFRNYSTHALGRLVSRLIYRIKNRFAS